MNWTDMQIDVPLLADNLLSVHFIDEQYGCVTGEAGLIFETTDGGQSWNRQYVATTGLLQDIAQADDESLIIVGVKGNILKNANGNNPTSIQPLRLPHFKLYPNPTSGKVWVEVPSQTRGVLQIFDLQGRKVMSHDISGPTSLTIGQLPSGVYLCRLVDPEKKWQPQRLFVR